MFFIIDMQNKFLDSVNGNDYVRDAEKLIPKTIEKYENMRIKMI